MRGLCELQLIQSPSLSNVFILYVLIDFGLQNMREMYVAANVIFFIILPSPETEFNQKKKRRGPELHCNLRAKVFFLQFFTFPLRRSFVSSLNHKSITVLGLSFCHSFLVFSNYFRFVDFFRRTFNSPSSCVFQLVFLQNVSSPCLSTRRRPRFKPAPPRAP